MTMYKIRLCRINCTFKLNTELVTTPTAGDNDGSSDGNGRIEVLECSTFMACKLPIEGIFIPSHNTKVLNEPLKNFTLLAFLDCYERIQRTGSVMFPSLDILTLILNYYFPRVLSFINLAYFVAKTLAHLPIQIFFKFLPPKLRSSRYIILSPSLDRREGLMLQTASIDQTHPERREINGRFDESNYDYPSTDV